MEIKIGFNIVRIENSVFKIMKNRIPDIERVA
jgi:hypothetical protein